MTDTQPLSAEERQTMREVCESEDFQRLMKERDELKAKVSEIAKQALSYEGEARQLMQDRDHWKERAEKAEACLHPNCPIRQETER